MSEVGTQRSAINFPPNPGKIWLMRADDVKSNLQTVWEEGAFVDTTVIFSRGKIFACEFNISWDITTASLRARVAEGLKSTVQCDQGISFSHQLPIFLRPHYFQVCSVSKSRPAPKKYAHFEIWFLTFFFTFWPKNDFKIQNQALIDVKFASGIKNINFFCFSIKLGINPSSFRAHDPYIQHGCRPFTNYAVQSVISHFGWPTPTVFYNFKGSPVPYTKQVYSSLLLFIIKDNS